MDIVTKEMEEALRKPLDPKAIKPHPTKTYLSSIKAIYVTERFSEVFGVGGWRFKVESVERTDKGMTVVKVIFEVPKYGIYYESFGGNDNGGESSKNFDLGDAYKGATTDALTKIGSYLGVGIDVFKGESTPTPQGESKSYPEDNRPWLSEAALNKAIERIEAGEKGIYEKTDAAFRMKKDYRNTLKAAETLI